MNSNELDQIKSKFDFQAMAYLLAAFKYLALLIFVGSVSFFLCYFQFSMFAYRLGEVGGYGQAGHGAGNKTDEY